MKDIISLVILNYNSASDSILLSKTLLDNLPHNYKIFLVDNCSSDYEILQDFVMKSDGIILLLDDLAKFKDSKSRLLLIKLKQNNGYAYGNNAALQLAYDLDHKFSFIINPDVEIPNFKIFEDAISVFYSKKKIGIIGYRVILPNGKNQGPFRYKPTWSIALRNMLFPFFSLWKNLLWYIEKKRKGHITVHCVVGCFFGVNLNHLHSVKYFDENTFLYYEEQILADRMFEKGYSTIYCDNYYVKHNHSYFKDLGNDPYFIESKNYYLKTYVKPSLFSVKVLELSKVYYKVIWESFFKKLN